MKRFLCLLLAVSILLSLNHAFASSATYTASELYPLLSDAKKQSMKVMWDSDDPERVYLEKATYTVKDGTTVYLVKGTEMEKLRKMILANVNKAVNAETAMEEDIQKEIERTVTNRLFYSDAEFWKVGFDQLTIAPYGLTDASNKISVRIYLSWSANNGKDRTKKMLNMFSDDLAATLAKKYTDKSFFIAEIWFFWDVPNITKIGYAAKYKYTNLLNKMYLVDSLGPLYGKN